MENQSSTSLSSSSISAQGSPIIHSFSFEHPVTEDHFLSALSDSVCSKYTGSPWLLWRWCYYKSFKMSAYSCQNNHMDVHCTNFHFYHVSIFCVNLNFSFLPSLFSAHQYEFPSPNNVVVNILIVMFYVNSNSTFTIILGTF